MKHTLHALIFLSLFTFCARAQVKTSPKPGSPKPTATSKAPQQKLNPYVFFLELDLEMGIPMRDFADASSTLPFGGGGAFFYQPARQIPVMVGFDLGYMNMGIVSQDKILTADITVGNTLIDQLIIPLRIQTNNNIFSGHLILRSMTPTRYFKLYAEGLFGFSNYWTGTEISDESPERYLTNEEDNVIARSNQISDAVLSYGAGGGLLIELNSQVFINLRADYLFGGSARYFDKSQTQYWQVEITDPFAQNSSGNYSQYEDAIEIAAIPKESKTDMLVANAGITFKF